MSQQCKKVLRAKLWLLVALAALGLSGCSGIDVDPRPQREFPKTDHNLTLPPADLVQR
jgi:hypothetical protein